MATTVHVPTANRVNETPPQVLSNSNDDDVSNIEYLRRHDVARQLNTVMAAVLRTMPHDPIAAMEAHCRKIAKTPSTFQPDAESERNQKNVSNDEVIASRVVQANDVEPARGTAATGAKDAHREDEDKAAIVLQCALRQEAAKQEVALRRIERDSRTKVPPRVSAAPTVSPSKPNAADIDRAAVVLQSALRQADAKRQVQSRRDFVRRRNDATLSMQNAARRNEAVLDAERRRRDRVAGSANDQDTEKAVLMMQNAARKNEARAEFAARKSKARQNQVSGEKELAATLLLQNAARRNEARHDVARRKQQRKGDPRSKQGQHGGSSTDEQQQQQRHATQLLQNAARRNEARSAVDERRKLKKTKREEAAGSSLS